MTIVLASQSPRRQELLQRIGVEDFKTLSLDIDPRRSLSRGHGALHRKEEVRRGRRALRAQ